MKRPKQRHSAPSTPELLTDIREILLHVLALSACPQCMGTGVALERGPSGAMEVRGVCACRTEAREFLAGWAAEGGDER